ncbi:MAG TPA: amidohydrolase family protein [Candidatus Dormibacteraeota bacterium]
MAKVIDCQFHWHPPSFFRHHQGRPGYPRARPQDGGYLYEVSQHEAWKFTREFVDLEFELEEMSAAGVDAVVCSPAIGGDITDRELSEGVELAALLNSETADAQQRHSGRLYGLAVLPMQETQAAVKALDEAASLGLRGICMFSNINGRSIAAPEVWPVYERAQKLNLPIFLHPTRSFREERVLAYEMERPLGYMFDSSFAAASLIVGGVLDAFPGLKFVLPHLGGTLPYLAGRLETYRQDLLWGHMNKAFDFYLRGFYYDTVSATPGALALALQVGDPQRLLFATDYPYFSARQGLEFVRNNLPESLLEGVCHVHAEKLLGLEQESSASELPLGGLTGSS